MFHLHFIFIINILIPPRITQISLSRYGRRTKRQSAAQMRLATPMWRLQHPSPRLSSTPTRAAASRSSLPLCGCMQSDWTVPRVRFLRPRTQPETLGSLLPKSTKSFPNIRHERLPEDPTASTELRSGRAPLLVFLDRVTRDHANVSTTELCLRSFLERLEGLSSEDAKHIARETKLAKHILSWMCKSSTGFAPPCKICASAAC